MRCCEAWQPVGKCFDPISFECIDFHRLSQIIASFARENLAEREAEIGNLPWTQTEKDNALAKCRLGLRAWRAKKPVLCLHAVNDEDGHPLENEDESGRRLCEYWSTIFQARVEGQRHHHYENILRYVQKAPDDIRWIIDKNEFDELIYTRKQSAPGPDGIPCSFHSCAVGLGSQVLFNAYKHVLEGGTVRVLFPESRTVFIPKSSDVDNDGRLVRSPEASRPLTLCCDCKILTSAICRGLHWFTRTCVHLSQRCMCSRQMTDNIFQIVTAAPGCLPQCQSLLDLLCAREHWIARLSLPLRTKHLQGQHHTCGICRSRTRTISDGQRSTTRLSCERPSVCNCF